MKKSRNCEVLAEFLRVLLKFLELVKETLKEVDENRENIAEIERFDDLQEEKERIFKETRDETCRKHSKNARNLGILLVFIH